LGANQIIRKLNVEDVELDIYKKKTLNIYEEVKYLCRVLKNPYKKFPQIKIIFLIKKSQKVGNLSYDTCIRKTHIIRFLMLLLSSINIHFTYIIIFWDLLLKGL